MAVLGADPDHLERLADALGRGARRVADDQSRLSSMVRSLELIGPAADRLRIRWLPVERDAGRAAELLELAGRSIRVRARRQRSISDPSPGGPPPSREGAVLVEVLGDPGSARQVAIVVPGMGTSLADAHRLRRDGERLRTAAGPSTAVIVWVGSSTPHGWAQAASDRPARTDGAALARFVADLRARTTAELTVIGHSYGSTTMAWAARSGMDADRLVALGSPGLGVEHLAELGLPASVPLYASISEGDPVAHLRWFGNDPTAPSFGAHSFDAGVGGGHGGYFAAGSASLENLARIVRGESPTPRPATPLERWVDELRTRSRVANETVDELQARLGPAIATPEVEALQLLERAGTRVAVAIGGLLDDWAHQPWG